MCGILGTINKIFNKEILNLIFHRGPNSFGIKNFIVENNNLIFAQTRLAIVDLSKAGVQPMVCSCRNYSITLFNGGTYNHKDLRQRLPEKHLKGYSGTETILYYLIKFGISAIKNFNRIFGFSFLNIKNIKDKGYKFTFTIIGEGKVKDKLIQIVREYKLKNEIKIIGAKYEKELSNYFEQSNVFVLPGARGLAVNEAMAYSLPILSTPADGTVYDLVENNINGFLIEYGYKIEELEEKLMFFIKTSQEIIIKMENESLRLIQERATLENQVNQFLKAINL